ncbi:hypothetical protein ACP275_12G052300 [Erythranthe tilingii]
MEGFYIENTIPQHIEPAVDVDVAAVAPPEEKLENVGGDDHGLAAERFSDGCSGTSNKHAVCSKKKRGRPMKQPPMEMPQQFVATPEYFIIPPTRGRGRPRGSGRWQRMAASFGGIVAQTEGSNFTPHRIEIQKGENIVQRIKSFSMTTPDSICIVSAFGTVSTAEIFVPASPGGISRYEGNFSIVHLNGSHTYNGTRHAKRCILSVQLANPEGLFCGGVVANSLIAGGPTQLVIATFKQNPWQLSTFS